MVLSSHKIEKLNYVIWTPAGWEAIDFDRMRPGDKVQVTNDLLEFMGKTFIVASQPGIIASETVMVVSAEIPS